MKKLLSVSLPARFPIVLQGLDELVQLICKAFGESGIVEEPCLIPFAATDVGLGWQLADHPAVRRVDRDRLTLDVLSLNKRLVAALDETSEMMVDVMLGVPIVPG